MCNIFVGEIVRGMMSKIFSEVNLLQRQERPVAKADIPFVIFMNGSFLHICFQSIGCCNDKKGSCVMCDYGFGRPLDCTDEVLSKIDSMLAEKVTDEINSILIGTYGSVFDPNEISPNMLDEILYRIEKTNVETVIFETHYTTITTEVLKRVNDLLQNKKIVIEMGLESADENVQKLSLNKFIDLNKFKTTINLIHSFDMEVTVNVLLGAPLLTTKEQIDDCLYTINWSFENSADTVVLFPVNVKPYTLLYYWYTKGRYLPISQWLFIELLNNIDYKLLNKIALSWYGNRKMDYVESVYHAECPADCPTCHNEIMKFYEEFIEEESSQTRRKKIDQILVIGQNCSCYSDVKKSLKQMDSLPLQSRFDNECDILSREFRNI